MAAAGSSAVFFLGTRAHYQVLQQPDTRSYDLENGNASTETIYRNPSAHQLWPDQHNWNCYENGDVTLSDEKDRSDTTTARSVKRRSKRRQSETTLCDRDNEMRPALLNNIGDSFTKPKSRRRVSLLAYLSSLARRKRRLDSDQVQYLQHLESALNSCSYRESCRCLDCQVVLQVLKLPGQLDIYIHSEQVQYLQHLESAFNSCSYRESCRCLDCQSRYFDCDESEEYSSGESEYAPQYVSPEPFVQQYPEEESEDENDEVFIDTVPDDNTSTDLLIEKKEPIKMSVSSDEVDPDDDMQLEVAAGTPVLLNYLLTHPITCAIQ